LQKHSEIIGQNNKQGLAVDVEKGEVEEEEVPKKKCK